MKTAGFLLLIIFLLINLSCGLTNTMSILPDWTQTPTAFQPVLASPTNALPEAVHTMASPEPVQTNTPTPTPLPTALSVDHSITIDERLPDDLEAEIIMAVYQDLSLIDLDNDFSIGISDQALVAQWIYCVTAPFPTVESNISLNDLVSIWQGGTPEHFQGYNLLLSPDTAALLIAFWGVPDANAFEIVPAEEILEKAWEEDSLAIIPFEELDPLWKVLEVDGQNPIRNTFKAKDYPLTISIGLTGGQANTEAFLEEFPLFAEPENIFRNRDPEKLTNVMLTGVTALVRSTAYDMENRGITYPATDLGPLLSSADITHISNEVPFAEYCPFPNPNQQDVRFCSDTDYIELLEVIGTDVVELTGDHFADYGVDAMLLTLEMYADEGWVVYGGGETAEEAKQAILLEHNGNKIAFIGCNGKGYPFSQASETIPGSVTCDYEFIEQEIQRLSAEGYLTIVTYQHHEYYTYSAPEFLTQDFDRMAEAGAAVVSGSQAHHPHNFAMINGGFVHYGLGNMFFDQYSVSIETRQSFIDRHVFYNGQYISTELIPIMFVDFSRARLMTDDEAADLLETLFPLSTFNLP